ncbi:MAG: hypothetical protein WCS15_00160 [Prevotella sp.]|nr:hypothetical protein [Massilibacteroides sp.]
MKTGTYTPDGQTKLYYMPTNTEIFDGYVLGNYVNSNDETCMDVEINGEIIDDAQKADRLRDEAAAYGFSVEYGESGATLRSNDNGESE